MPSGETVVERLLALAGPSGSPCFVSTNDPQAYEWLDVPLVADLFPDRGAPGGVVTALACATTEWVTVVACDMPFIDDELIEQLADAPCDDVDAICFTRDGHLEPLCARYRRSLCFDWSPRLEGNPSMHELLQDTRVRVLTLDDPDRLMSFNAPSDLRESFRRSEASAIPQLKSHTW